MYKHKYSIKFVHETYKKYFYIIIHNMYVYCIRKPVKSIIDNYIVSLRHYQHTI